MTDKVRIFVGTAANDEDLESQAVLESTIRKHTQGEYEITWMKLTRDPASPFYSAPEKDEGWHTRRWATPFSGFRWAIPALCEFKGRAVYFDSDFIVQGDVVELNALPIPEGKAVIAKGPGRFCCSVWDCEKVKIQMLNAGFPTLESLQKDPDAHKKMGLYWMKRNDLIQTFDKNADWNTLDIGLPTSLGDIIQPKYRAIHYTQMPLQPHLRYAVPRLKRENRRHWYNHPVRTPHPNAGLQALFDGEYEEARRTGFVIENYMSNPLYGEYNIRGGQ